MKSCTCYALRAIDCTCKPEKYGELYTSPKAKQEQRSDNEQLGEPVAVVTGVYGGRFTYAPIKASVILPAGMALYSSPQQRTWVGLTAEEREQVQPHHVALIAAVEAKLKQKNGFNT